jgi:hypothetical protein
VGDEPLLSYEEARTLTADLKKHMRDGDKKIAHLYNKRVWVTMGYPNWDAYVDAEGVDGALIRVPRENHPEMVRSLTLAGLGVRPIGKALGISRETVRRIQRAGDTNVSPPQPKPKPIPKPDRFLQQYGTAAKMLAEGAIEMDRLNKARRFLMHHDALIKEHRDLVIWTYELVGKVVPHFDGPDITGLDDDTP